MEHRRRDLRVWIATAWLAVFFGVFFSQDMPNNSGIGRLELWVGHAMQFVAPGDAPQEAAGGLHDAFSIERPQTSGWKFLPQRVQPLFTALFILAGALSFGRLLLRTIRFDAGVGETSQERAVLSFGTGTAALSLLVLGCGGWGTLSRPLFVSVLWTAIGVEIALTLLRWATNRRTGFQPVRETTSTSEMTGTDTRTLKSDGLEDRPTEVSAASSTAAEGCPRSVRFACITVIAVFGVFIFLGAGLPSVDFDVKEYHIQGPKEFYQNGRIAFLPHNVYTSFPFLTETLSLLAMVVEGDWFYGALAGKVVLAAFAPLTALAVYCAGRRWFSPAAGWIGAAVYLTTPWTYRISTIAYAEGGLTFFAFAAVLAAGIALEHMGETGTRRRVLVAGVLAGGATACKYTGLVQAVVPVGAMIAWGVAFGWRRRSRQNAEHQKTLRLVGRPGTLQLRLATVALFAFGVLAAVGPWFVKNAVETGNPVYPLAWSIFGGRDWDAGLNAKWTAAHSPNTYRIAGIPGWMFDVSVVNDWLSPLLYGFAPLVLFSMRQRRSLWFWLLAAYLFLAWWGLTHRLDRFWVPMLPVIALLAGAGAAWLYRAGDAGTGSTTRRTGFQPVRNSKQIEVAGDMETIDASNSDGPEARPTEPATVEYTGNLSLARLARIAFWTAGVAAVLFNLTVATSGASGYNAYLVDLQYAREWTAMFTAPEIATINARIESGDLPAETKVLAVGEAEVFDARFPILYNTVFDRSLFEQCCTVPTESAAGSPTGEYELLPADETRRILKQLGVTHVLVNWSEVLRYRLPGSYGFTSFVAPQQFARLVRTGVLEPPQTTGFDKLATDRRDTIHRLDWDALVVESNSDDGPSFVTSQIYRVR